MTSSSTKQPLLKQHRAIIFKSRKSKGTTDRIGKKRTLKCVLVGDGAVGKTSLAMSYSNCSFPNEYVPTAFDNYSVTVQVDGQPYNVHLCDTAGQNELTSLRGLCYSEADVFILCFSVVQRDSFRSAQTRWLSELSHLDIPIVLVGTQSDLRNHHSACVTFAEAQQLSERICAPFIETSALNRMHLKEAFDHAILAAIRHKNRRNIPQWRKLCCMN